MSQKLHWSGSVYYYVAALIGLAFALFGAVGVYSGLLQAALPRSSPEFEFRSQVQVSQPEPFDKPRPAKSPSPEEVREQEDKAERDLRSRGFYQALEGTGAMLVGIPVFLWHINRARKRESSLIETEASQP